tara:strand:+ start:294 stop:698 length:405 start_codon:yes stop_codon:yes gene_type:complete
MISPKIIKIASNTNYNGLENKFTHKSSVKNSLCGDLIKTEFILEKSKIKSMRYETEACILCEASASLFAKKIKNKNFKSLIKKIKELKKRILVFDKKFPKSFNEFNQLIDEKNKSRLNCVILPMEAFLKAFKIR